MIVLSLFFLGCLEQKASNSINGGIQFSNEDLSETFEDNDSAEEIRSAIIEALNEGNVNNTNLSGGK